MAEYIEREALIGKLQEALDYNKEDKGSLAYYCFKLFIEQLKKEPTADVVEVVRCKDCKHAIVNEKHENKPLICCKTKMCGTVSPHWYCADGKRKDDAE